MKRNYPLYILAWIFLIPLLPVMMVGAGVAILFFTAAMGFKFTAQVLTAWSNKI